MILPTDPCGMVHAPGMLHLDASGSANQDGGQAHDEARPIDGPRLEWVGFPRRAWVTGWQTLRMDCTFMRRPHRCGWMRRRSGLYVAVAALLVAQARTARGSGIVVGSGFGSRGRTRRELSIDCLIVSLCSNQVQE